MIIEGSDVNEVKNKKLKQIKKVEKKKDDPFDVSNLDYQPPELEFDMDDVPDCLETTSILLEIVENIENLKENI